MSEIISFHGFNLLTNHYDGIEQVQVEETIGTGGYGKVRRGIFNNSHVAVKVSQFKPLSFEKLMILNHPCLVKIHSVGINVSDDSCPSYVTVMEEGTRLQLKNSEELRYLLVDILEALVFLHENKLVHCDIKTENIIQVNRPEKMRPSFALCDLDFVCPIDKSKHGILGTIPYLSPEAAYLGTTRFPENDIFALGATLYFITTGSHIWQVKNLTIPQMLFRIGLHHQQNQKISLDHLNQCNDHFIENIITDCVSNCPRPMAFQLLKRITSEPGLGSLMFIN